MLNQNVVCSKLKIIARLIYFCFFSMLNRISYLLCFSRTDRKQGIKPCLQWCRIPTKCFTTFYICIQQFTKTSYKPISSNLAMHPWFNNWKKLFQYVLKIKQRIWILWIADLIFNKKYNSQINYFKTRVALLFKRKTSPCYDQIITQLKVKL